MGISSGSNDIATKQVPGIPAALDGEGAAPPCAVSQCAMPSPSRRAISPLAVVQEDLWQRECQPRKPLRPDFVRLATGTRSPAVRQSLPHTATVAHANA